MRILIYIVLASCTMSYATAQDNREVLNLNGESIADRIKTPPEYERVKIHENTFEAYLRTLPLKPPNTKVKLYNGVVKKNYGVYIAVVNLDIGKKNLHQCADAVIRLRADYHYFRKEYEKIHFNFTNGFRADYSEWMKGKRIIVNGNTCSWKQVTGPSNTYNDYWDYLETVFTYAGTLSLSKEMKTVNENNLMIGDVFIKGGNPGHAVIIVDMAINVKNGKKIFLLAQSYMPAQEIHILKNPVNESISPWYYEDFGNILITPEWSFKKNEIKRFE